MTKALMTTAALGLALALAAGAANAQASRAQLDREHARAVAAGDWENDPYDPRSSDALNRAQLQGYTSPAQAPGMASEDSDYGSDMTYTDTGYAPPPPPQDETVVIQGTLPADSPSSFGQPDTNPQSSGTPMTNQPYAVPGGTPVPRDDDTSGF